MSSFRLGQEVGNKSRQAAATYNNKNNNVEGKKNVN